jgi:hypothetical protein
MSRNVPDDWDCYWETCSVCGSRYHMSEGGCSCLDSLESCQCGACDWESNGNEWRCAKCGTGPAVETFHKVERHVARKDDPKFKVVAGDTYAKHTKGGYFPGGSRWLTTWKKVVAAVA